MTRFARAAGIAAMGMTLVLAGGAMGAEQAKPGKQDKSSSDQSGTQAAQGQSRNADPAAPTDRDRHLGPQGGELSEKISPKTQEQETTGSRSNKQSQAPVEQQSPGPASGK